MFFSRKSRRPFWIYSRLTSRPGFQLLMAGLRLSCLACDSTQCTSGKMVLSQMTRARPQLYLWCLRVCKTRSVSEGSLRSQAQLTFACIVTSTIVDTVLCTRSFKGFTGPQARYYAGQQRGLVDRSDSEPWILTGFKTSLQCYPQCTALFPSNQIVRGFTYTTTNAMIVHIVQYRDFRSRARRRVSSVLTLLGRNRKLV